MQEELPKHFDEVSQEVRKWSKHPPKEEFATLYGLFKQATIGDFDENATSSHGQDDLEKAKLQSWKQNKGTPKDEAKKKYIELAGEWKNKYA